jgi:hypothetical protein
MRIHAGRAVGHEPVVGAWVMPPTTATVPSVTNDVSSLARNLFDRTLSCRSRRRRNQRWTRLFAVALDHLRRMTESADGQLFWTGVLPDRSGLRLVLASGRPDDDQRRPGRPARGLEPRAPMRRHPAQRWESRWSAKPSVTASCSFSAATRAVEASWNIRSRSSSCARSPAPESRSCRSEIVPASPRG